MPITPVKYHQKRKAVWEMKGGQKFERTVGQTDERRKMEKQNISREVGIHNSVNFMVDFKTLGKPCNQWNNGR